MYSVGFEKRKKTVYTNHRSGDIIGMVEAGENFFFSRRLFSRYGGLPRRGSSGGEKNPKRIL